MAKGMSLEKLKVELDTAAQEKCVELESANKSLNDKIELLIGELQKRSKDISSLQYRCLTLSHKNLCCFCTFKGNCSALKTIAKEG
jgi:hypothetical protein